MKTYVFTTLTRMIKEGRIEFVSDPSPDWGVIRWSKSKKVEIIKIR